MTTSRVGVFPRSPPPFRVVGNRADPGGRPSRFVVGVHFGRTQRDPDVGVGGTHVAPSGQVPALIVQLGDDRVRSAGPEPPQRERPRAIGRRPVHPAPPGPADGESDLGIGDGPAFRVDHSSRDTPVRAHPQFGRDLLGRHGRAGRPRDDGERLVPHRGDGPDLGRPARSGGRTCWRIRRGRGEGSGGAKTRSRCACRRIPPPARGQSGGASELQDRFARGAGRLDLPPRSCPKSRVPRTSRRARKRECAVLFLSTRGPCALRILLEDVREWTGVGTDPLSSTARPRAGRRGGASRPRRRRRRRAEPGDRPPGARRHPPADRPAGRACPGLRCS